MNTMALPGIGSERSTEPPPLVRELRRLEFFVNGEPRGMGSKSAFAFIPKGGGKPRAVVTDAVDKNPEGAKKLASWKDSVTAGALVARGTAETLMHAVAVELTFHLRRPSGHYTKAGKLRPSAPRWPETKPDVDKLKRSTLDALKVSGIFIDDARVVRAAVAKVYAESNAPTGAQIVVEEL